MKTVCREILVAVYKGYKVRWGVFVCFKRIQTAMVRAGKGGGGAGRRDGGGPTASDLNPLPVSA